MATSKLADPSDASLGHTKGGNPHKRPLSDQKEGTCPVKSCRHSFRHRPNPQQAIWQHLAYYLNPMCAESPASPFRAAHIEMHEKMKAESASKRLSASEQKERQKESKKKWVEKNKEKRALSLKKSNIRKKAKRELNRKGGTATEAAIEELVGKWLGP
ncbi:hypothetical protein B9Z19DRAFT_1084143 [Tuber borchii]|uniref:Uncharacterized protein n=1 Tax=Tuber borchii TaxID=42251 RepID=A0A2T6ZSF9_TUBBO|nr:hypothetical protein B9Z19DRAFT_1084143 [Tuber borchii]